MKKTKDVLIMCQFFYPEYVSSATLPYDTAEALTAAGFSVGAICGYPKEYTKEKNIPKKETVNGIEIKRLKYIQMKRSGFLGRIINYFSFVAAVFFNLFEARKYKTVIAYSNPPVLPFLAVIAKKLYGCKLIFVSYDVYPEIAIKSGAASEGGIITKALRFSNKHVFKNADTVVAVSEDMKDYLENNRSINKDCKVLNIPNWYEDKGEGLRADAKSTALFSHINDDDFVVSYLGNLGICQDEKTILQAIRRLKDNPKIKFVFAGHGNKMAALKNTVKEEGLENVSCFDFLTGKDFEDALAVSNCYIVSLVDGLYGLCAPSKAYSYMMQGRAIACIMHPESEIGSDVIKNRAGGCFNCGEGDKLADFFTYLQENPKISREMGKNCRQIFLEKYEKKKCLNQYKKLISDILNTQNDK